MVTSVETEKAFGKTQHPFKIMIYSTQEIERPSLSDNLQKKKKKQSTNSTNMNQRRNLTKFRGTILKAFIMRLKMRRGCLLSPFTISGSHHKPQCLYGSWQ